MNRFDDWEVDCADCQHYWDDSCSGVPTDQKRNCTAYVATKNVDIPERVEKLMKTSKMLCIMLIVMSVWLVVSSIISLVQP